MVELCDERGMCVGSMYFKHRSLNKYTRGDDGEEVKSMKDTVLVKNDMRGS